MKLLLILLLSLSYINITQSSETMSAKDKTLYDYIVEDKDYPNFIEWGKTNNTLLDLITNNWLGDKTNFFMCKDKSVWNSLPLGVFCKFDGKHPSKLSHQIIAKKLLKYMGDYND